MRHESTEELVGKFSSSPGVESVDLDFKSKEILDSTGRKKKLVKVLSSMANRGGGTIIIGVRREGDSTRFQDFDVDNEYRQELTHIAQQYTRPYIQDYWELTFDECVGHHLLRIDIESVRGEVVKFDGGEEEQAWIRDEDGMRIMDIDEIEAAARENSQTVHSPFSVEQTKTIRVNSQEAGSSLPRQSFSDRTITKTEGHQTAVYNAALSVDWFGKSHSLQPRASLPHTPDYETILEVMDSAAHHLSASTSTRFGYTIRVGNAQLHGVTRPALEHDLSRLGDIHEELGEVSDEAWTYGPSIAGCLPVSDGVLWFEYQVESDNFARGDIGLILPDMPLEDEHIRKFFSEVGQIPHSYNHRAGTQFLQLRPDSNHIFSEAEPRLVGTTDEFDRYAVTVDNPFRLIDGSEQLADTPERLVDGIGSQSKILLRVGGGYIEEDESFSLRHVRVGQVSGTHSLVLIDALCSAVNPDSEMIQT